MRSGRLVRRVTHSWQRKTRACGLLADPPVPAHNNYDNQPPQAEKSTRMKTMDDLVFLGEAQREAALRFCESAEDLAREANGIRGAVLPAPVAYDLLGNLKVALGYLTEVARFMPTGVMASLSDPRLAVYDRNCLTGEARDPAVQAALAAEHMHEILTYLSAAAEAAEDAQVALNSQGYDLVGERQ